MFQKLTDRWNIGAKAVELMDRIGEVLRWINIEDVLAIVAMVIQLEREVNSPGSGAQKLQRLVDWFIQEYPQHAQMVGTLKSFASALVGLFNLVRLFKVKK